MRITLREIKDQAAQTLTAIKSKHVQSLSVGEDLTIRGFLEELKETGAITMTKSCKDHWMNERVIVNRPSEHEKTQSPFRAEIINKICHLMTVLDQVPLSEKHVSRLLKALETETRECIQELYRSREKRRNLQEVEKRKREMARAITDSAIDLIADEDLIKEPVDRRQTSQKDRKPRYVSGRHPKRHSSRAR